MGVGCTVFYFDARRTASESAVLAAVCVCLAMAGMNPTAVASAGKMTSVASMGVMLPAASSGAILMPWLIGRVGRSGGTGCGHGCQSGACVGLLVLAALVARLPERLRNKQSARRQLGQPSFGRGAFPRCRRGGSLQPGGAELAAAVILPVQAVLLRQLQRAQIPVLLFEVRGRCRTPNSASSSWPMALIRAASLWGADGQGGGKPVKAVLGSVLSSPAHPQPVADGAPPPRSGSASNPAMAVVELLGS